MTRQTRSGVPMTWGGAPHAGRLGEPLILGLSLLAATTLALVWPDGRPCGAPTVVHALWLSAPAPLALTWFGVTAPRWARSLIARSAAVGLFAGLLLGGALHLRRLGVGCGSGVRRGPPPDGVR